MNRKNIRLVYFSPTHTSQKIVQGIANGMMPVEVTHCDLTLPDPERANQVFSEDDFVIFGMPVYGGRIPAEAVARLKKIHGKNTLAAIVVVYGNRAYEDALLELKTIVTAAGFTPIAAGAFIGEHSFSNSEFPIGAGRPDEADITEAEAFGQRIVAKLNRLEDADRIDAVEVPGNFPYKDGIPPSDAATTTNDAACTMCESCGFVCPTGAIGYTDRVITDNEKCILCCACVRSCPSEARALTHPPMLKITTWLFDNFKEPRKPETFI